MNNIRISQYEKLTQNEQNKIINKYIVDCFKVNKYQALEENVLYTAMNLYELIKKPIHIDELFTEYSKNLDGELSINLERILYLALTFLFVIGKIKYKKNLIMRLKK